MDQKEQKEDNLDDDILNALDENNKLNLTADQIQDGDEQIDQECQNFLNQLKGEGENNEETDQMLKQFQGMMGNILGGLNSNPDQSKQFQEQFKQFEQNPQFDDIADKMLMQFMDKEILEQPMKETQQAYIKYLTENKNKLSEDEIMKYNKQKDCVDRILEQLETNPNDKEKLVELFELMQAEGDPPSEVFGGNENPLNFLNAPTDGAQGEPCTIF